MFEVSTLLDKVHRAIRKVPSGFVCKPGLWGWIDNNGTLNNIVDGVAQPNMLKPVFSNVSGANYESNDAAVGRVTTIECLFRATVDTDGFQKKDTAGNNIVYTQGMLLTPAFAISTTPKTGVRYCSPDDLGKLRPAIDNETAVAEVVRFVPDSNTLQYQTISSVFINTINVTGSGSVAMNHVGVSGTGIHS